MAGTSSVGYALATNHRIISNDIQQYSFALSRCLLDTHTDLPLGETIWELLKPRIDENKEALQKYLGILPPNTNANC